MHQRLRSHPPIWPPGPLVETRKSFKPQSLANLLDYNGIWIDYGSTNTQRDEQKPDGNVFSHQRTSCELVLVWRTWLDVVRSAVLTSMLCGFSKNPILSALWVFGVQRTEKVSPIRTVGNWSFSNSPAAFLLQKLLNSSKTRKEYHLVPQTVFFSHYNNFFK
jgi:hypothetical protein